MGRFLALTEIRPLQNHGPRLFDQNWSISDNWHFLRNLYEQSPKQLEIHLQACRPNDRELRTVSHTFRNTPSSKPWAIAQAYCPIRSISDPCEFSRNLYDQAQKQLQIYLQACRRRFREFGRIYRTYRNPTSSKPWAIAQAFRRLQNHGL